LGIFPAVFHEIQTLIRRRTCGNAYQGEWNRATPILSHEKAVGE
jgi:hypothetical protein